MRREGGGLTSTPPYVELHCHSVYSFGGGASMPEELMRRASELGHEALALTDHCSLSGAMEHATAAGELNLQGSQIRAIFGAEMAIAPADEVHTEIDGQRAPTTPRRLTLLVEDQVGWRSLCRLITLAHTHTRDSADRSASEPYVSIEQICEHAHGLVCLTGCAERGIDDEGTARRLLDAFGQERLRVELQRPYMRGDRARNRMLERLASKLGVQAVATGGVRAHTGKRAQLQDALVAVKHGLTLDSSEAVRMSNHSHVLSRPEAMAARFADHPEAVRETLRLAERLRFELRGDLGYRYPGSSSRLAARTLAQVCEARFEGRYPRGCWHRDDARMRLDQELQTIAALDLSGFFLLHHEILELAREVALAVRGPDTARSLLPPGRGRGSSVSSIVCYLTGLSHIDPIENELAVGRFLHEDITGMPDIDVDFPRDIREKLIPAIHKRYGRDRTALVAAFPTYRARGAIRDLGKALGLPAGEIERVARAADGFGGVSEITADVEAALGRKGLSGRWEWLARLAHEAHRLPRGISQHSGGMVISTRPLIDCCPIVPAAMEGRQILQWDKDSCSDASFLKIDLLGLGMLSAVERCVELITRQQQGEPFDLSRIAYDDEQTYECIRSAETTGVFQIESRAQMTSLYRTQPENLADLTVQVALVRPGPIVGGSVSPYVEHRAQQRKDPSYEAPYLHPSLREPLRYTLGAIIFQDQVIDVARAFAGFTAGEAESLRRAMSRKRSDEAMARHHERFIEGAMQVHEDVDLQLAEKVWGMVAGFAGYGFPKAHAAAFGLLAYQSTWLRVHHPTPFLCSLLNEQPMGFYPPDSLIHEAQRRGLTILPPNVNESEAECEVIDDQTVRIGLAYVKGVRQEDVERLLAARDGECASEAEDVTVGGQPANAVAGKGAFASFEDLAARSGASSSTLQLLAWSGACDTLASGGADARRVALWQLGVATPSQSGPSGDQLSLALQLPKAPRLKALGEWEKIVADYSTTGMSIETHPLTLLRDGLDRRGAIPIARLREVEHGRRVEVGGLVIARQKPQTAKGTIFLLLEDEGGTLNVIVPRALYETSRLTVKTEPLVLASGRLERHPSAGGAINLLAVELTPLAPEVGERATVHSLGAKRTQVAADAKVLASAEDFKTSVPAFQHFGQGRRR